VKNETVPNKRGLNKQLKETRASSSHRSPSSKHSHYDYVKYTFSVV